MAQFAPCYGLNRNLNGDAPEQRLYLAPKILSAFDAEDAETVQGGVIAKEMARNLDGYGQCAVVQNGGPDGIRTRGLRRDRPAC